MSTRRSILLGVALGALLAVPVMPSGARADCALDDAGCDEDDGGTSPDDDGGPGGPPVDAGPPPAQACSCEVDRQDNGRIHVCAGSFEADVCERLDCEDGALRRRACDSEEVVLCCEMESRGTYAHLYADCSHPNCEAGFRQQCFDFSGDITEGACDSPSDVEDFGGEFIEDEPDGLCAVRAPGVGRSAGSAGSAAVAWMLVALALRTRRPGDPCS